MKTIVIGKLCSHKGCNRMGQTAEKLSDFWVVRCSEHEGKSITLDFGKIPDQKGQTTENFRTGQQASAATAGN